MIDNFSAQHGALIDTNRIERIVRTLSKDIETYKQINATIEPITQTQAKRFLSLIEFVELSIYYSADKVFISKETLETMAQIESIVRAEHTLDLAIFEQKISSFDKACGQNATPPARTNRDMLEFFSAHFGFSLRAFIEQQRIKGVGIGRSELLASHARTLSSQYKPGEYLKLAYAHQTDREVLEQSDTDPKNFDIALKAAEPLFRLMNASVDELKSIHGIRDQRARAIHQHFQNPSIRSRIITFLF